MLIAILATVSCLKWEMHLAPKNCQPSTVTLCGENFDHECTSAEYTEQLMRTIRDVDPEVAIYNLRDCEVEEKKVCVLEVKSNAI